MKLLLLVLASGLCLVPRAQAETTVKLSNVHLCCNACVKGVERSVAKLTEVTAEIDKDGGTVTFKAANDGAAQKAVTAMAAAGYHGKADNTKFAMKDDSGAKDEKVASLKITNIHMCCKACVRGLNKALSKVDGVTGNDAVEKVDSFTATGNFNAKALVQALHDAGFHGKVGK
ncbi:MAG: hypothetical protein AB1705_12705 [Verrucomicrobiota bacterium]